jgi:hypothetical protein
MALIWPLVSRTGWIESVTPADDVVAYCWVLLGVLIAAVWPPIAAAARQILKPTAAGINLRKYAVVFAFCALTAVLALVVYRKSDPTGSIPYYLAIWVGYTWEATIEKAVGDLR